MSENNGLDFGAYAAQDVDPSHVSAFTCYDLVAYANDDDDRERPLHPVLLGRSGIVDKNPRLRAALNAANAKRRLSGSDEEVGRWAIQVARTVWPVHVFTGWRNVLDSAGNAVPFSAQACRSFMESIPDHVLGDVIRHYTNHRNFVRDPALSLEPAEVEETAGN